MHFLNYSVCYKVEYICLSWAYISQDLLVKIEGANSDLGRVGTINVRLIVTFSEAVASLVPWRLRARQLMAASWAGMLTG